MELIIDHENAAINAIITERTAAHWQDAPEFSALLEPAYYLDDPPVVPGLQYLLKLVGLICQSDEEQSNRVFLLLESHCAVAEPAMVAQVLARFIMEGAEPYPNLPPAPSGWLAWVPDYKPELLRKGEMVKRLWRLAKTRGEDIEQMAIQWIVSSMARRQDSEQHTAKWRKQAIDPSDASQDQVRTRNYTSQSVIYLLCCGPLSDQEVVLWHQESLLNTLVRIRDGRDPRALENQQLILVNLLDRFFLWMDHKEEDEDIEQLKFRIISHTKTPELLQFAMDAILRYQDGRWVRSDFKDEGVRTRAAGLSLMETNRDREPIHYRSSDQSGGPFGFSESKNAIRGKPLKEREVPRKLGRLTSVQTFEVGDLVAQCMDGHEADTMEQLLRSLILHIGMRVDTAMVSASSAVLKHAAQQRDKILLRLVAENPVYRRIMISAMEQVDNKAAALACLPVIQGMLRCCIAHWSSCKNASQQAYPKELEEATWVAQLAEKTGLIPPPINQAVVLFPLIQPKDIGMLMEQCYYVLLVRNADTLQHPHQPVPPPHPDSHEILLIRRLIFKHAERAVRLMSLFAPYPPNDTSM